MHQVEELRALSEFLVGFVVLNLLFSSEDTAKVTPKIPSACFEALQGLP